MVVGAFADRAAQLAQALDLAAQAGVGAQPLFHLELAAEVELAVDEGVDLPVSRFGFMRCSPPWVARGTVRRTGRAPAHQRRAHQAACARQARHHGADRNVGDAGDVAVRQLLELAQHQHLAVADRQRGDRLVDLEALGLAHGDRLRLVAGRRGDLEQRVVAVVEKGASRPGRFSFSHE